MVTTDSRTACVGPGRGRWHHLADCHCSSQTTLYWTSEAVIIAIDPRLNSTQPTLISSVPGHVYAKLR